MTCYFFCLYVVSCPILLHSCIRTVNVYDSWDLYCDFYQICRENHESGFIANPPQKSQVLNPRANPWSESHIRNRNRNASPHFLPPLFSVLARPYITICSRRARRHSAGLSNSAPLRETFDFICSVSCSGRRWGHLLTAEGVKRHAHPVLGDTKLTMHLSLNNVNVLRIRWQRSRRVRWGRRAVRRADSLALLQQ